MLRDERKVVLLNCLLLFFELPTRAMTRRRGALIVEIVMSLSRSSRRTVIPEKKYHMNKKNQFAKIQSKLLTVLFDVGAYSDLWVRSARSSARRRPWSLVSQRRQAIRRDSRLRHLKWHVAKEGIEDIELHWKQKINIKRRTYRFLRIECEWIGDWRGEHCRMRNKLNTKNVEFWMLYI